MEYLGSFHCVHCGREVKPTGYAVELSHLFAKDPYANVGSSLPLVWREIPAHNRVETLEDEAEDLSPMPFSKTHKLAAGLPSPQVRGASGRGLIFL